MRRSGAVAFGCLMWSAAAMAVGSAQPPDSDAQETRPAPALFPTLVMDADFRTYPSPQEGNTGFAIARLRPGLRFSHGGWFSAVGVAELAGGGAELLDAYARLRVADWASLTAGLSTPPLFLSAVHDASFRMPFPDRAPVVRAFRIRRDLGLGVELTPAAIPLELRFRVGNGTGSPTDNDEGLPALYGNLEWVSGALRLGLSVLAERAGAREGISGRTPVDFVYFRPGEVRGWRRVGVVHATALVGPVRLVTETAYAREARDGGGGTPGAQPESIGAAGLTAAISWVLHGLPRGEGSAPGPLPCSALGALELSARYDGMWLGLHAADVLPGGSQGGAVALKWWATPFLSSTLAGTCTHYTGSPADALGRRGSWSLLARVSVFWGQG